MNSKIPFAKASLGREEEEAVLQVLRSGWITTSKECFAFEQEFADFVQSPYAAALSSATAGLHLALDAIGLKAGDAVITSPYTFAATAEVIRYFNADPLFVDIDTKTLNLDTDALERALEKNKERCKAIIPVHIAGLPCNMPRINWLAKKFNVYTIEDAAHSFPSLTKEGYAGTLGDIGVFSFYATKSITTAEGGMLVCHDKEILDRVKLMRLHGIDRDIWNRYTSNSKQQWRYDVREAGYKYNLNDISAAIGRVQLSKAKQFHQKRTAIAEKYLAELEDEDSLILPQAGEAHAWHLFILQLNEKKLSIDRDAFLNELTSAGIGHSVHFIPLHTFSYYKNRYAYKDTDFPNAYQAFCRAFSIPIYPDLTEQEQEYIIKTIKNVVRKYRKAGWEKEA